MIKRFSIMMIIFLLLFSVSGQTQTAGTNISGEGVVVAFQKTSRHSVTPVRTGIGTFVEFWIVRIDKWTEGAAKDQKYILVEFMIHERAVSDSELNSDKLRFRLRERRADEHTDCLGSISVGSRRYAKFRQTRLSDYQRTKVGSADKIPPLTSLPCFIADEPPVVIESKN
jgi:hypothetical protein